MTLTLVISGCLFLSATNGASNTLGQSCVSVCLCANRESLVPETPFLVERYIFTTSRLTSFIKVKVTAAKRSNELNRKHTFAGGPLLITMQSCFTSYFLYTFTTWTFKPGRTLVTTMKDFLTEFPLSCLEKIPGLFQECFFQDALHCTCASEPIVYGVIHGQHASLSAVYTKMQYPHALYMEQQIFRNSLLLCFSK